MFIYTYITYIIMTKLKHKAQPTDIVCPIIKKELIGNPYIKATEIAKKYGLGVRKVQYHMTYHITPEDRLSAVGEYNKKISLRGDIPPETDLAYIAGFLDADGSMSISRYKNDTTVRGWAWRIRTNFTNTDKNVLEWIQSIIGGYIVEQSPGQLSTYNSKSPIIKRNKPVHNLNLSSNQSRKFLPYIRPYLKIKQDQADILIEALSLSGRGWRMDDERLKKLIELETRMKKIRKRENINCQE